MQTEIEYLGYEISESVIRPCKSKISAVARFETPKNVHQVRQYLGLTGYFRKFIRDYASKARPLCCLLAKDVVWKWGDEQQQSFEVLKQALTSIPVLALYDPGKESRLYTDASRLGLAGILVQVEEKN